MERFARAMSAVTLVIVILQHRHSSSDITVSDFIRVSVSAHICVTLKNLPAFKSMLQKVKQCFLHHVCYLEFQRKHMN